MVEGRLAFSRILGRKGAKQIRRPQRHKGTEEEKKAYGIAT